MNTEAYDMTRHWRLITAESRNDDYRVYGTWWLSIESQDITAVDVTIWDRKAGYGFVYGRELSFHDGAVAYRGGRDGHHARVKDTHDLVIEVCNAILETDLIEIRGDK